MKTTSKAAPITLHAQMIQVKDRDLTSHRVAALVAPGTGLAIHRALSLYTSGDQWILTHLQSGFGLQPEGTTFLQTFKEAKAYLANVATSVNLNIDLATLKKRHMATKQKRETMQELLYNAWSTARSGDTTMVACEICGAYFNPASTGYYEAGKYAYCCKCCKW